MDRTICFLLICLSASGLRVLNATYMTSSVLSNDNSRFNVVAFIRVHFDQPIYVGGTPIELFSKLPKDETWEHRIAVLDCPAAFYKLTDVRQGMCQTLNGGDFRVTNSQFVSSVCLGHHDQEAIEAYDLRDCELSFGPDFEGGQDGTSPESKIVVKVFLFSHVMG